MGDSRGTAWSECRKRQEGPAGEVSLAEGGEATAMSIRATLLVLWLALVAVLGVMGYFMLDACGLRVPGGPVLIKLCGEKEAPPPALVAQVIARGQDLEREVVLLEQRLAQAASCPAPPFNPLPEPDEQAKVEPEPEPKPEPKPQQQAEKKPEPKPEKKPEKTPTGTAECPRPRPTEVAMLLDASASMDTDFNLDPAKEERYEQLIKRHNRLSQELRSAGFDLIKQGRLRLELGRLENEISRLWRTFDTPGERNRMEVAKSSLKATVKNSPSDIDLSLMSFSDCGRIRMHGSFSPSQRNALLSQVDQVRTGRGTALAEAIRSVPRMISGGKTEDKPVNIVLFSDGRESCGGNACAQARALKQQYPHLYINVIAIGKSDQSQRCIANATGGLFLQPDNTAALAQALKRASGQDIPEHCQ